MPVAGLRAAPAAEGEAGAGRPTLFQQSASSTATPGSTTVPRAALPASVDFNLFGLVATAAPASQTLPKNTATRILIDAQPGTANSNPNYRVRGELSGPSFGQALVIEAPLGQPLSIPPLPNTGDHLLQNLRIVDLGQAGAPVVGTVVPDSAGIVVIDQILISQVRVRELNYDEIVQSGININDNSYRYFNFTLALATSSGTQEIQMPVAFPPIKAPDPRPITGVPSAPVGTPVPDLIPVMFDVELPEGIGSGRRLPGRDAEGSEQAVMGLLIFPGRVGFLQQHFEALVIVANGAPQGSGLVVKELRAKISLPANPEGPPLAIAETQVGGRVDELALHGPGPDGAYATADDTDVFAAGETGQASFLLKGLRQGTHPIDINLKGKLDGLANGPVNINGKVSGAVLVRDASIAVSFTHPAVVRKDQEYDLSLTLFNQGGRDIQGAKAQLSKNSISGAVLVEEGSSEQAFQTTIKVGLSATVSWRLRAKVTGVVSATYVTIDNGGTATLGLVTGVGDRGVPLSPDSLTLPEPVKYLPQDVAEAATAVLGQTWSIATAPPGSLPGGVRPVSKKTVRDRAVDLGIAGLRIRFGEAPAVSLETLARDWLGESESGADAGFADVLRNTPAGYRWYDSLGAQFYKRLSDGQTALALHQELADTESPRSPFISALITQAAGPPIAGASLVDSSGQRVGLRGPADARNGDLPAGGALRLTDNPDAAAGPSRGQLLVVSSPDSTAWTLELTGWRDGTGDISLLIPSSGSTYRQVYFSNLQIAAGGLYRIVLRPFSSSAVRLEEDGDGVYRDVGPTPTETALLQARPRVVGAIQAAPELIDGGDPYGRLIGVLFSRPMAETSAETPARYQIGGGLRVGSTERVGGPIRVTAVNLSYGNRFAFLALDSPVGPYIKRDVTINGVSDQRGQPVNAENLNIEMTVSPPGGAVPGAYLTGRVLAANGLPAANTLVTYQTRGCDGGLALPLAGQRTDAQGYYAFDYVRESDCSPVIVSASQSITGATKELAASVLYDRQHMVLDLVFLARGRVQGTITIGNSAAANAFVSVMPQLDTTGGQLVQADEQGRYQAKNIPVGNVSVLGVGFGDQSNATGLAVGTVNEAGATAIVNIPLGDLSGVIKGRVVYQDGASTPSAGALVVAFAGFEEVTGIPGFGVSVGYAFTERDGSFTIRNLPLKSITLVAKDAAGNTDTQQVALTGQDRERMGILLPHAVQTYGAVAGKVLNEVGTPIPDAEVRVGYQAVKSAADGTFAFAKVSAGNQTLSALDPTSRNSGLTPVSVRANETAGNLNIIVARPGKISGRVFIQRGTDAPVPVENAFVSTGSIDARTDAQGAYTLNNVPANTAYILRFVHPNGKLGVNQPAVIVPGEALVRNATFTSAALRGTVFQPGGVTPTLAQLKISTVRPDLTPERIGLLTQLESFTQSQVDGTYALQDANPGPYSVSASNVFFPVPVRVGGVLSANQTQQNDLVLADTLAGKIQGRVFQPQGTPCGAGVKVTLGSLTFPEATVLTDEAGHYEFAEVFPSGAYDLTAADPLTMRTSRLYVNVESNRDATFDITLLGSGALRLRVVDATGLPVASGDVRVEGFGHPFAKRYSLIETNGSATLDYADLPEGLYGVSASRFGLSGRGSIKVVKGATAEITVKLEPAGTVTGRVIRPERTSGAGLSDVSLFIAGRQVGMFTSLDTEGEAGAFSFENVPVGTFELQAFDNRTGRRGSAAGVIGQPGEIATVNIQLTPIGNVRGQVTANGAPVSNALVSISDAYRTTSATTDREGRYRFTGIPAGPFALTVSNAPGGAMGQAAGQVVGDTEPLDDTVVDIAVQPTATFEGRVDKSDGSGPLAGARVTILAALAFAGGGPFYTTAVRDTTTDEGGRYRLDYVPIAENVNIRIRAQAPGGYDRGEVGLTVAPAPGQTVTTDVRLAGLGSVSGQAKDHLDNPLAAGIVTLVNDEWGAGERISITAPVQADGRYLIANAPAGRFTLNLSAPDNARAGLAAGTIVAGQTVNLDVRLEDAGMITGVLKKEMDVPVANADITLRSRRPGDSIFVYLESFTHTDSQGRFMLGNIRLGELTLIAFDPATNTTATINGRGLTANRETVDYGDIVLDTLAPTVEAISPADGTTGVIRATEIIVRFSEPVQRGSVNDSTVKIVSGATTLMPRIALSDDRRQVTLSRNPFAFQSWFADLTAYTVMVTPGVKDDAGHALPGESRSGFTTADETAPSVTEITPADGAVEVPPGTPIKVKFNEPLKPDQEIAAIVQLYDPAIGNLEGVTTLSEDRKSLTFMPGLALGEGKRYQIYVSRQQDDAGNIQFGSDFASFATIDRLAPTIGSWQVESGDLDGQRFARQQFYVSINYEDAGSGVNTGAVVATLDGVNITGSAYVSPFNLGLYLQTPLAAGAHTLNIKVPDRTGSLSEATATFTIDNAVVITEVNPPVGVQFGGTLIQINGIGLENSNGSRPEILIGGNRAEIRYEYYSGDCTFGRCVKVKAPPGQAGPATVEVRTDHGTARLANGFTYQADPRTPFVVEPDTVLLWHLDEVRERGECSQSPDAGPFGFDTDCYRVRLQPGRFNNGASGDYYAGLYGGDTDANGVLAFGSSGFTLEGWFKTVPVIVSAAAGFGPYFETTTLLGREDRNGSGQEADYALKLLGSGALQARLLNQNGEVWETTMPAAVYPVNDEQWHNIAMVVERGAEANQNRLVIYVDGEERAASLAPAGFGAIRRSAGYRFGSGFDGLSDEIRVSSTAHTAAQIRQIYANNTLTAVSVTPGIVERGAASEVTVSGYKLANATAAVTALDGSPISATIEATGRSATQLRLLISIDNQASLGDARLTLTDGSQSVTQALRVVSPRPFTAETGTLLLWHLDEVGTDFQSDLRITDAGPLAVNGTVRFFGTNTPGRFGGTINSFINADDDGGALAFRDKSFTVEFWMMATFPSGTLLEKSVAGSADFTLGQFSAGSLRATLYNDNGAAWQAEFSRQGLNLSDQRWHLVNLVVERGPAAAQNHLTIYVDGEARASTPAPAGFGPVRNSAGARLAVYNYYYHAIDELRILNRALTAEQALDAWIGRERSGLTSPLSTGRLGASVSRKPPAKSSGRARIPVRPKQKTINPQRPPQINRLRQ